MAIPLILADDDTVHMNRMAEWILVHPESGFYPIVAENRLPDALPPGLGTPVVLFGGAYWEGVVEAAGIIRAIKLRNDTDPFGEGTGKNGQEIQSVSRYQPISGLLKEIRAIASERGWISHASSSVGNVPLALVVHLSGATHLQPVAPVLAVLSARVRKTLYLDLDPAGHSGIWFPSGGGYGLSRLAYLVRGGLDEWEGRFENCLFQDVATGVHSIREPDLPEDAGALGAEEVAAIRTAAGHAGFGSAFVDAGLGLDRRNLSLMPLSTRIFLVCSNDMPGLRRASAASSLLGNSSDGVLLRESAAVHWMFCGGGKLSGRPDIPSGHFIHVLPEAYPDGFPVSGWAMDQRFLSDMSAFTVENGNGSPTGGAR